MQSKQQNTKTLARKIEGMKKIRAAYVEAKAQGNVKKYKVSVEVEANS